MLFHSRFENGRIIANENDEAQRLYYILSGKIKLVKKFELSGGDLFKIIGILNKGEATDVKNKTFFFIAIFIFTNLKLA